MLDLRLANRSGVDLIGPLRAAAPGVAVAVLTSFEDSAAAGAAIRAGARGFLMPFTRAKPAREKPSPSRPWPPSSPTPDKLVL